MQIFVTFDVIMEVFTFFSFLAFIGGGQCFFGLNPNDFAKIKRRAFDVVQDKTQHKDLNARLYDFLRGSNKRSNENGNGNEEVHLGDIIYQSTISSSGQTTGNVVLTAKTPPTVDILWMYEDAITNDLVITQGQASQSDSNSSSLTLTDNINVSNLVIVGSDFGLFLAFHADVVKKSESITYSLANFVDFIKYPSIVVEEGNKLVYDVIHESDYSYGDGFGATFIASFGEDGSSPTFGIAPENEIQHVSSRKYRFSCTLPESGVGEQVWTGQMNKNAIGREKWLGTSLVFKKIPISRPTPVFDGSIVFIPKHDDTHTVRLRSGFESLGCLAIGKPLPRVDFYKDGQLVEPTFSKSYFGLMNVTIVSLNGKSMDEAIGSYTCKGTSGTMTMERQYIVEQFEQK